MLGLKLIHEVVTIVIVKGVEPTNTSRDTGGIAERERVAAGRGQQQHGTLGRVMQCQIMH